MFAVEELWSLILVAPALFALLACAAGARRAEGFRPDWKAIGVGGLGGLPAWAYFAMAERSQATGLPSRCCSR
jgi:hypothetical protein